MPGLHMNRWRVASAAAWIALTLALLAAPAIDVERTVQAAQPLEVIGHLGGAAREVVVRDRYAYIATGAALEVWDLRDPTQPRLSGTLPRRGIARGGGTSNIMRLRLEGPHAFLADRNMVQIVDVADPAAPREAGRFARLNATFVDLAVRGRHLYLANGFNVDDGVVIVDISNPSAPVEVGRTADGRYDRLLLSGDRLFALGNLAVSIDRNDRPGMRVYDITAAAPVVVAETTDIRSVGDAALDESHLFKVFNDVLTVFDVSDPARVRQVGRFTAAGLIDRLAILSGRAYLTHAGHVEMLDISDPKQLRSLGVLRVAPGSERTGRVGLGMAQDLLLVTDSDRGFAVVSGVDRGELRIAARRDTDLPGQVMRVAVADGRAYVLTAGSAFVVDISNLASPAVMGRHVLPPGSHARGIAAKGSRVYLSVARAGRHELHVLDMSAPAAPRLLALADLGEGFPDDLLVRGDIAYGAAYYFDSAAAIGKRALRLVDVSDPAAPRLIGSAEIAGVTAGEDHFPELALTAGTALLRHNRGLALIDVSDPTRPTVVGSYEEAGRRPHAVVASGARAYVAQGPVEMSVTMLDIADRSAPRALTSLRPAWAPYHLGLSARHLYGGSAEGLEMFEVNVGAPIRRVASAFLPEAVESVVPRAGHAFVADGDGGLYILHTGDADAPIEVPPTRVPRPAATATPSGPTPTPHPVAMVCPQVQHRVPAAVLNAALANPESILGWNQLEMPSQPPSPFNTRRTWLTVHTPAVPYHLLSNSVLYRARCP